MPVKKKGTPISSSLGRMRPARYLGNKGAAKKGGRPGISFKPIEPKREQPKASNVEPMVQKKATAPPSKGGAQPKVFDPEAVALEDGPMMADPVQYLIEDHTAEGYSERVSQVKDTVLYRLLDIIDAEAASQLTRDELGQELAMVMGPVLGDLKVTLNRAEQEALQQAISDELLGLGPLEVLLRDDTINDVMVNGPHQVYIERKGKIQLTNVRFRDDRHLLNIVNRICNTVGRHVDQRTPLADARLLDGSRVNVIVPPLALKGPTVSIRKFGTIPFTIDKMIAGGSMSQPMGVFLKAAAASQLNIVVSGGTGSGKTTLLNSLSKLIDPGERIVTIEDAAELRLQQPHVVPLETRPKNIEGEGEVTIRDLVINALRMRPDRIIVGEVRGPEVVDMLQAMNTGHEGSMGTIHANGPREALTRMENMATLSGLSYTIKAIRRQIADALDLIIQVSRMRDGHRRVTNIVEVVGMEGDVITTQELFHYRYDRDDVDGTMLGTFDYTQLTPACIGKLREFGYDKVVMSAFE
jgi:pilus assembly protein CpaF